MAAAGGAAASLALTPEEGGRAALLKLVKITRSDRNRVLMRTECIERDAQHTRQTCCTVASVHRHSHASLVTVQKEYLQYLITNVQQAKRNSSANKNTYNIPGIRLFHPRGDNREDPLIK